MNKSKLYFYGGVETVTGANFVLEDKTTSPGVKIMIDCGLVQGGESAEKKNYEKFVYNPSDIDFLIVTHAHMDHIGRIPKLVKDGFKGVIYSTKETREIVVHMFEDELRLMRFDNEGNGSEPLFTEGDILKTMSLWKDKNYYEDFDIGTYRVNFKDAGHVLGSIMVEIERGGQKIVFTGDLGNSPSPFLRDTDLVDDANYLVMESVYGDRNHESKETRTGILKKVIKDSIERGGTLLIPAFSLERTQIILYEINKLVENKDIPSIPVFLDSPLAIKITDIYRAHREELKASVQKEIYGGDDIFDFPNLKITKSFVDSKEINNTPNPKIIIAGSGMSYGGRIVNHEKKYLGDQNNTILFVGYQAGGSLGRQIQEGKRQVSVNGENVFVRAHIESIMSYSSHKDSLHLIDFVSNSADTLKKVFVAMGEPKSSLFLAQRLRDYLGVDATVPKLNDGVDIEV
ncbi:MBL fold metallo-hydrolase [Candidatus Campbellbacteria bacterium CG22_combo_CG10-13_8_21_14_all_36_13]|uniref:MBL fold metallo-hydrolase n=1 Tax=Candidatus Campbellbacteria bacterium CG22_combo_CG10-13_8_21_14_all_36_13 TaxID=1974529 RepID=A0A2H0E002_9BACT|nr:MAG: MBL fold metallo-hydrolase [Candidatus Campbellbacteria bacterium CG22_combo_CG10-13_8_21_14_all_36_13]